MAEKKPVSVNWQSLFIIIPIVDLWAAYRVKKFRIYFFVFWVGFGILDAVVAYAMLGDRWGSDEGWFVSSDPTLSYVQIAMWIAEVGLAVYFIRKWSKRWNESFRDKHNILR